MFFFPINWISWKLHFWGQIRRQFSDTLGSLSCQKHMFNIRPAFISDQFQRACTKKFKQSWGFLAFLLLGFWKKKARLLSCFQMTAMDGDMGESLLSDPEEGKDTPGCSVESRPFVLSENEGEIKSPENVNGNYPNNVECHWRVAVAEGKVRNSFIRVSFCVHCYIFSTYYIKPCSVVCSGWVPVIQVGFNLHSGCIYDKVSIYDGPDVTFPLISSHCGNGLPVPVEGTSNQLYVTFESDESITQPGFTATYGAKDPSIIDNQGEALPLSTHTHVTLCFLWNSRTVSRTIFLLKCNCFAQAYCQTFSFFLQQPSHLVVYRKWN